MTRLEQARAEIARRRALALAPDPDGAFAWYAPSALREHHRIGRVDGAFIAANDPAHVLAVLAAADATLDRHVPIEVLFGVRRWYDCGGHGPGLAGPSWPCPDALAVLDLYAPEQQP